MPRFARTTKEKLPRLRGLSRTYHVHFHHLRRDLAEKRTTVRIQSRARALRALWGLSDYPIDEELAAGKPARAVLQRLAAKMVSEIRDVAAQCYAPYGRSRITAPMPDYANQCENPDTFNPSWVFTDLCERFAGFAIMKGTFRQAARTLFDRCLIIPPQIAGRFSAAAGPLTLRIGAQPSGAARALNALSCTELQQVLEALGFFYLWRTQVPVKAQIPAQLRAGQTVNKVFAGHPLTFTVHAERVQFDLHGQWAGAELAEFLQLFAPARLRKNSAKTQQSVLALQADELAGSASPNPSR